MPKTASYQSQFRVQDVPFSQCIDDGCDRANFAHMHCPCGCSNVTTVNPPIVYSCESCSGHGICVKYDRKTRWMICNSCCYRPATTERQDGVRDD